MRVDPKARKRAKDRLRQLTSRRRGISMERRIKEINRFTVGWTAYFALADTPSPFEELDEWLRRRLTAGPLEGVETYPHQATQPDRSRYPRGPGPPVGLHPQGILAHRRVSAAPARPTKRLLEEPRPEGIHRPLPPLPGCQANRRMRTRTSGGVGGAGVSPAPTRFRGLASGRRQPLGPGLQPAHLILGEPPRGLCLHEQGGGGALPRPRYGMRR